MTTLAAIATATERIRLGTFVLNNDMRNPVQLAWEAVSLDRLSGGRFELGLGAGHTPQEYAATGHPDGPGGRPQGPARRVAAGAPAAPLADGRRPTADRAPVGRPVQDRVPLLVGGNGARLLGAAGELADIIGLQGLGRTLEDGHRHEVKWTAAHLDDQIAAGARRRRRPVRRPGTQRARPGVLDHRRSRGWTPRDHRPVAHPLDRRCCRRSRT